MKKITHLTFVFLTLAFFSCDDSSVELTTDTNIVGNILVEAPQTSGSPFVFDEIVTQDLEQIISNFNEVTDVNIDEFSYRFANLTGNSNAVIESGTIKINDLLAVSVFDIHIGNAIDTGSVFTVNDQDIKDQLGALLLNNENVKFQFSGSVLSDEGTASFNLQVLLSVSVTF